jgi:hypothetical protein
VKEAIARAGLQSQRKYINNNLKYKDYNLQHYVRERTQKNAKGKYKMGRFIIYTSHQILSRFSNQGE